jgi:hypothetical protein
MYQRGGFFILFVVLALVGFGIFGNDLVEAQQSAEPKSPAASPTPPISWLQPIKGSKESPIRAKSSFAF